MPTLRARPAVNETSNKVSQKFPKRSRLLRHADFQVVYRQGKKHFSRNVTAFYRECDQAVGPRIGLTVGKILGGAVERNRMKRRLRTAVRRHLRELSRPLDLVLHPKKSVLTLKFAQLDAEIGQIFAALQRGRGK